MSNFFKNLKIFNSTENKVITTDANGILKSSDKSVDALVTSDVTDALASRVTELENVTTDMGQRLQDING